MYKERIIDTANFFITIVQKHHKIYSVAIPIRNINVYKIFKPNKINYLLNTMIRIEVQYYKYRIYIATFYKDRSLT